MNNNILNTTTPSLLTEKEAAAYLRVSQATISREIRDGRLKACKFRRCPRIRYEDLMAYIEESMEGNQ